MGDNLAAKGMGLISGQRANDSDEGDAAHDAEVFGKYAPKGKAAK